MPTVNVSKEGMEKIELIRDQSEWDPSNREIVDKALSVFVDQKIETDTTE